MKLLHISELSFDEADGVNNAVPPLIESQNKIEGITSSLLLTSASKISEDFFYDFQVFLLEDIKEMGKFLQEVFKADLVIFHGLYYLKYIKIYKVLIRLGIPYLVKPHCSLTKYALKKSKIKKSLANFFLFNDFISNSRAISFLNEGEYRRSVTLGRDYILVSNGISKIQASVKRKSTKNINLIYLGRIDFYHKGINFLLEAIELINGDLSSENIQIDIYGKGKEQETKRLIKRIRRLNNKFVKFRGPVFGRDKEEVLAESNIFILTSLLEGLPMSILEALAHGLPCIVTPGTNMASVIKRYKVGWVTSNDPIEIAQTILKSVKEYRVNYERYIKDSNALIEEKYNWEDIGLDSIKKYYSILNR